MEEYIKKVFEPIVNLSKTKLLVIAFIVSLAILSITTTVLLGTEKEYVPLFQEELKPNDTNKISAWLTESGFKHKIDKTTNAILIPNTDKSYILLKLSEQKTLPEAKASWDKVIDQRTLFQGTTQQEFELNYVRGLQEEIATALKRMDPIKDAIVTINKPKKTTFKEKEPSANILLKLRPYSSVDQKQIKAIRDFVCSAVEGLKPDKIEIFEDLTSKYEK